MEAAEDHFAAAAAVPIGKFEGAARECQVHRDADHFRQRVVRRAAEEQVFVPIFNAPGCGGRGGEADQCERGRQDVLSKTRVGIFGIEGVDQQRVARLDGIGIQPYPLGH